jgi:hypothetical protein
VECEQNKRKACFNRTVEAKKATPTQALPIKILETGLRRQSGEQ